METQVSICQWANETFGTVSTNLRVAARANEEMAELIKCLSIDEKHPKAAEEAADVVIVLCRLFTRLEGAITFEPLFRFHQIPLTRRAVAANDWLCNAMGFLADGLDGEAIVRLEYCVSHLALLVRELGTTLQAAIDAKMKTNRSRSWKLDGTGHGYHVNGE